MTANKSNSEGPAQKNAAESNPDVETFKRMVRLLEWKRRYFLEDDWRRHSYGMPRSQFNQLMLVRHILPCNLGRIMSITGLTSAGASIFVDKLVQNGIVVRADDVNDRRNVLISFSEKGKKMMRSIDDKLDAFITNYFETCCDQERRDAIEKAMLIICDILTDGGTTPSA